jgi:hypothetical protein
MAVVTLPPLAEAPSIIGPLRRGHAVIVEGRAIPRLHARELDDEIELVLDERFSVTLPKEMALPIAWLVAHALAIGAGYSHLGAEVRDQPFAAEVLKTDLKI